MILENIDLNDYIIKTEKSGPRKLYKCICQKCHQECGYKRISEIQKWTGFCRSCSAIVVHTGKIVSEETKSKMKQNHHLKNGGIHPWKGKHLSEETKHKISISTCIQNKNYKHNFIYNNINMRSSWEVKYAQYLDQQGVKWEYEPIFQLSSGRTYIADFKLEDGSIIEIKGYFREDSKLKWDLFCLDFPNLNKVLLMKPDLKQLGIVL